MTDGAHEHDHEAHHHGHGHENDRGLRAILRYLRWAPRMWRSEINTAVIAMVAPAPGEHVLDIGAGMGAGTMTAARSGASVVAIEPTPFMRRILVVRRLFQRSRSQIEVIDGAAEHLPVPDQSIDAVWAVNTMHHWIDPERGAAEIGRALRPGGRVVLIDEDFQDPSHPDHDRFGDHHDDDDEHHHGFTMVDAEQMGGLLAAAGLIEVQAENRELAGVPVIAVTAKGPAMS